MVSNSLLSRAPRSTITSLAATVVYCMQTAVQWAAGLTTCNPAMCLACISHPHTAHISQLHCTLKLQPCVERTILSKHAITSVSRRITAVVSLNPRALVIITCARPWLTSICSQGTFSSQTSATLVLPLSSMPPCRVCRSHSLPTTLLRPTLRHQRQRSLRSHQALSKLQRSAG
jgi:hypothetical protein